MAAPSVVVIGGGVGGLTAAHELSERGFAVSVYEARPAWGGKARSQPEKVRQLWRKAQQAEGIQ